MDEELQQLLARCSFDTKLVAKTFFPDRFWAPFAKNIHDKIFELIDGPANKVAIAAPRGWGKTSIVALALMARWIMFRQTGFIVYINKSETAAIMQTENLKRELVSNRNIKRIFGPIRSRGASKDEIEESYSKKSWVAYDSFVLPRGAGQQVRGVLFRNDRPGLIIIDDLEDKKKVMNEDLRAYLKNWFFTDVLEAIPQLHMNWKVVYIDTLKHEDALLQHLLDLSDWKSIRLESCDDNFKSTAPEFVPDEVIKRKWEAAVEAGETDAFYQEQRNLPISSKDATFKREYFRYYNLPSEKAIRPVDLHLTEIEVQNNQDIENVVIVDPAKTKKLQSADTAIVGLGFDLQKYRVLVRDIISDKMYPDELYDNMFDMAARLDVHALGIEETSLNEFIKQPIKNEMFKRRLFYTLVWLKPRGGDQGKPLRVKELAKYYKPGYVYHNMACEQIVKLEGQLLMFPRSKLWDIMDALAYFIQMLEIGERYFFTEYTPKNSEDEYKDLKYEKPLENWRVA